MDFAVIPFPEIDPVAFSIGPVAVRWYGLAYMAGLLLGWLYIRRLMDEERLWRGPAPLLPDQVDSLLLWITVGVVGGGRLGFFLLYEPQLLLTDPMSVLQVWNGGMAFHGGLIGCGLVMLIFGWLNRVSVLSVMDSVAAAVPLGLFFGRIANFINAEVYGRPSDVPWAMVFPGDAGPLPRHPSQLYEAALEGIVLFLLLRYLTHTRLSLRAPGFVTGAFLAGYGVARSTAELFREQDWSYLFNMGGYLTVGMIYSLPMIALGVGFMLTAGTRAKRLQ